MILKVGNRYRSQVCSTEVVVVRPGNGADVLTCGGHPMVEIIEAGPTGLSPIEGLDGGTLIGKRYTDASGSLEVLVTKAGAGSLGLGSEPLTVKEAKPLPASD